MPTESQSFPSPKPTPLVSNGPMDLNRQLALALDPSLILQAQGMQPDAWQREFLLCPSRFVLLNCCRGAGKTRTTSALALHTALFKPGSLTLLISKAQRQ